MWNFFISLAVNSGRPQSGDDFISVKGSQGNFVLKLCNCKKGIMIGYFFIRQAKGVISI